MNLQYLLLKWENDLVYKVEYANSALKDLKKLPGDTNKDIVDSVDKNLAFKLGIDKELSGKKYKGLFWFRVNDYRVIYEMNHNNEVIILLIIAHRKEVYKIIDKRV